MIGAAFRGLRTAIHLLDQDPDAIVRLVEKADDFGLTQASRWETTAVPDLRVKAYELAAAITRMAG